MGKGYFTQYGCWDKENGIANGKGIWLTSSFGHLVFYDTRSGKVVINGRVSEKKVRKSGGVGEWMKDCIAMHARQCTLVNARSSHHLSHNSNIFTY